MTGGFRLLLILASFLVLAAALRAEDAASAASTQNAPPKVRVAPVEETLYGHKIVDNYRWLEDANSSETKEYVAQEMAYTRGVLDPLPGREKIHDRLLRLASVGTITTPQLGGKYYFYTRREGTQNQPVLLVREGVHGSDRPLVDVNRMAADGTVALDWWFPSEDGKYVAYGTSPSGSEESTLHIIETATGNLLPDVIERTRFSSLSWKKDNSGFYYTRHPRKGEVPAGEEVYHVKVFYHALGADSVRDPLIFGEGRNAQDIPTVQLSDDSDRWLLINVFEGWAKSELYLLDTESKAPPVELTQGETALYSGEILHGKLYIVTNEGAPHYRVMMADTANPTRENWTELIPENTAVLQNLGIIGGKLLGQYQKNASSLLRMFALDGKELGEIRFAGDRHSFRHRRQVGPKRGIFRLSSHSQYRRRYINSTLQSALRPCGTR